MYLPREFRVRELPRLHALIRSNALATLICSLDGALEANHVPVILDGADREPGRLRFHLARPNPAVLALDGSHEALMVFHGEEAYVSPDWYRNPQLVPTWNYAAVHAWGRPRPLADVELAELLEALSADQEHRLNKRPWTVDKLEPERYARMRRAIVGFEMSITRIEGKWKMSQNRHRDDRAGVIAALADLDHAGARATAALMRSMPEPGEDAGDA
jgi:transcriptional regulator